MYHVGMHVCMYALMSGAPVGYWFDYGLNTLIGWLQLVQNMYMYVCMCVYV